MIAALLEQTTPLSIADPLTREQMINALLSRLINLTPEAVSHEMDKVLAQLGQFAQVDRCYIYQVSKAGQQFNKMHEWCAPGIQQLSAFHTASWLIEPLKLLESICIPHLADSIFENKSDLEPQGIQSWLAIPLHETPLSFIGFDQIQCDRVWLDEEIFWLQRVAKLLGQIEARKYTDEKYRRFFTAVEQSASSIMMTDLRGQIEYVNPKFTQLTGYSPDEVIGQNPRILKSGDTSGETYQDLWHTINAGGEWRGEIKSKKKNGDFFWEIISISPLVNAEGEITHFLEIKEDITERKRVEEELQKREREYRELIERLDEVAYRLRLPDGYYEYLSPVVKTVMGYDVEEFLKNPFFIHKIIHPEYIEDFQKKWSGLLAGKIPHVYEYKIIDPAGQERWIIQSNIGLFDEEGNLIAIEGLCRNITQRKQAELLLKESERKLATLMSNLPGMAYRCRNDKDWTMSFVSEGAFQLTGYPAEDLINNAKIAYADLIEPSDQKSVWQMVQDSLHQQQPFQLTYRIRTAQGEQRWVWEKGCGIFSLETGEVQALEGFVTDITDRKLMELRLAEERASLAKRVEQRTAELSIANAELIRASRLKDEFLANMSHELRTPLNVILTLSELMQDQSFGTLNDKQLTYMHDVETSGRHLLTLINDILDLSKIEAGKFELQMEPFLITEICQASLSFIHQLALKKKINISNHFDNQVSLIYTDARRIKQILINLLNNAIKFTPEGQTIGLEVIGDKDQEVVHLTVWDSGIGIPKSEIPKLFQPFVQAEGNISRRFEGTGLGLALVRRLTELHGGCVAVDSEEGQGSRFTISLPWRESQTQESIESISHEEKIIAIDDKVPEITQQQALILIVEDNEKNIQTIYDYLQFKGYSLIVARNGREAIERVKENKPNLILMDIQMPVMDGFEATQTIRADPKLASIPIIALTALTMSGDRERCLAAGMNEYLSKPLQLKKLAQMIEQMLSQD